MTNIRTLALAVLAFPLLFTAGCSALEGENHPFAQKQVVEDTCALSLDSLAGTTWLMAEAMPDKTVRNNWQARMKFFTEDGESKAKYTVKSIGDVYTYMCKPHRGGKELFCAEPPKLRDWCQALEAHEEGSCTAEKLKKIGAKDASDEELTKAMELAKGTVDKYRGEKGWDQFKLNNNNLGNKLRGYFYAKVNDKACDLTITDMYMTIYNGKKREDSNPVGTNAFAQSTDEFLWEHCDDGQNLADTEVVIAPKRGKVPAKKRHAVNVPVYYHYYGESVMKAEADCSYSVDTFAQWKPVQSNVGIEVGDRGAVQWSFSHTWKDNDDLRIINPNNAVGVFSAVRYKTCDGKREKIDTVCNASQFAL
jgi:hypothetical protein